VIQQSQLPDGLGPGVRLKDLAAQSEDPTSAWSALRLLWDRRTQQSTIAKNLNHHEYVAFTSKLLSRSIITLSRKRKWNLWIVVFLVNVILAGALTFILGRVVNIICQVEVSLPSVFFIGWKDNLSCSTNMMSTGKLLSKEHYLRTT
jgi:hypothetical protein